METGVLIVTIDGPAGAGKSTVARALAKKLGWAYLDTGALYRAVALAAEMAGIDMNDTDGLQKLLVNLALEVKPGENNTRIFIDGNEATDKIREPHISSNASTVSAHQVVREALLKIQIEIGAKGRIVSEGRDMGTVVFPQAKAKFFLDAKPNTRAQRRFDELKEKGAEVELEKVSSEMFSRDKADSSRKLAPLKKADDAVIVDSSPMTINQVVDFMIEKIKEKIGADL